MRTDDSPKCRPTHRDAVAWLALACLVIIGIGFLFAVASFAALKTGQLSNIMLAHFPAVVGLPFAALLALVIVLFLESHSGRLEFEAVGFKFRGASGPIILWVLTFLAIVTGVRILW